MPAQSVDVSVAGKQNMVLIVDNADGSINYDHANWADAKLIRGDNPTPPTPSPTVVRVEAEAMESLSAFRVENNATASGGKVLSLAGGVSGEVGAASFVFAGVSGKYDVFLGTYDEADGTAQFTIERNGVQIGSVVLDKNLGSLSPDAQTKVRIRMAAGISVAQGDRFRLTGREDLTEHARVDFVEFVPAP